MKKIKEVYPKLSAISGGKRNLSRKAKKRKHSRKTKPKKRSTKRTRK
jgi:hypothetical protein